MLSEASYESTRRVLHEQKQVVMSFYVNVFGHSHDWYADRVAQIFDAYCRDHPHVAFCTYHLVGHSVGGKIALLCSVDHPKRPLGTVLALDPVDDRPPEFTQDDDQANKNKSLVHHHASQLVLTHATSTPAWALPPNHSAAAIVQHNPGVMLRIHPDAAHMCYSDNNGGVMGWMMRGGTPAGNRAARQDVHAMIRKYID